MSGTPLNSSPVATPIVAAGALFTDAAGRPLMVRTTYKDYWDIPGGYVEPGETPRATCQREVWEELGLRVEVGELLSVDWAPHPQEGDKVLFIFNGGQLAPETMATIRYQDNEIAEATFVPVDQIESRTIPRLAKRLHATLAALAARQPTYLEDGVQPGVAA